MSLGLREVRGRALGLVSAFWLLAVAAPGCGDSSPKNDAGAAAVPPTVQESNKNMEDFMNSQKAAKKK